MVVVAAGSGSRVGAATNKVLLPLHGIPVLAWSLRTVTALPYVDHVVVVAREEDVDAYRTSRRGTCRRTGGGAGHRWADQARVGVAGSLGAARADPGGEVDVVAVHDGARPLAGTALFDAVVRTAHEHGGALPARPQPGLVSGDGRWHVTGLVGVQTPQAFRAGPLLDAYTRAEADGFTGTDTAGCVATYTDLPVLAVPAPATNLKVTFAEDRPSPSDSSTAHAPGSP